ncbi:MAG: hypothetical protein IE881_05540 [Epsilonproteobacteria bacterium]|nr:hypothetical protein [Campylobacterota bacterium]
MIKTENERIAEIEAQIRRDKELLIEIKNELKAQTQILSKIDVFSERLSHLEKRITSIEGNQSRIVWIVLTAIIGALMALIVKG